MKPVKYFKCYEPPIWNNLSAKEYKIHLATTSFNLSQQYITKQELNLMVLENKNIFTMFMLFVEPLNINY